LKISMEKGMIKTGESEVREEAMPAGVRCRANRAAATPRKGPRMAPRVIKRRAGRSRRAREEPDLGCRQGIV